MFQENNQHSFMTVNSLPLEILSLLMTGFILSHAVMN